MGHEMPPLLARLGILRLGIEKRHLLTRALGVGVQIVIRPRGDALELVPTPGEAVFHVEAAIGIMGQLIVVVLAET